MTEIYEEPSYVQDKPSTPPLPQPNEPRTAFEGPFVFILVLMGSIGVYLVGSNYEQPSVYNTNLSPSHRYNESSFSEQTLASQSTNQIESKTFENQLKVSGVHKVNQKLTFSIDNFDSSASYVIDLGNGDLIIPADKTSYYSYPVSGSYLVELIATYKGKETILFSDFVDVYGERQLLSKR